MYTINVYNYSFQSKENIQHLLDQLIAQISFSNYDFYSHQFIEKSSNPNEKVLYIFIMNQSYYFHIKFCINSHSNILNSIEFEKMILSTKTNKEFETNKYVSTNNFSKILKTIMNLL